MWSDGSRRLCASRTGFLWNVDGNGQQAPLRHQDDQQLSSTRDESTDQTFSFRRSNRPSLGSTASRSVLRSTNATRSVHGASGRSRSNVARWRRSKSRTIFERWIFESASAESASAESAAVPVESAAATWTATTASSATAATTSASTFVRFLDRFVRQRREGLEGLDRIAHRRIRRRRTERASGCLSTRWTTDSTSSG